MSESKIKQDKQPVTAQNLHDLAANLNRSRFVMDSGRPYFVGKTEDGKAQLCRHERLTAGRES